MQASIVELPCNKTCKRQSTVSKTVNHFNRLTSVAYPSTNIVLASLNSQTLRTPILTKASSEGRKSRNSASTRTSSILWTTRLGVNIVKSTNQKQKQLKGNQRMPNIGIL